MLILLVSKKRSPRLNGGKSPEIEHLAMDMMRVAIKIGGLNPATKSTGKLM